VPSTAAADPPLAPALPAAAERPASAAAGHAPSGWAAIFGRAWRADLLLLAALAVVAGALRPLEDPDLPMHLAVGEWIARHAALPRIEPFAWTRAGAPYFATSWAAQWLLYAVLALAGPVGLRLLHGALLAAAGASVFALGRVARWTPGATLLVAAANVIMAGVTVPALRPQLLFFTLLPLAWAFAHRAFAYRPHRGERAWPARAGLFAASAVAVNTHLFLFPLVLAPVLAVAAVRGGPWRRAAWAVGSVALGWAATPYVLDWPAVVRFLTTPYALFRHPSPISELEPGFTQLLAADPRAWSSLATLAPLLAFPWLLRSGALSARERLVVGLYWTAGCALFGVAARGVVIWWLLILPFVPLALPARDRSGVRPVRPAFRRIAQGAALVVLGVLATRLVDPAREGSVVTRRLPTSSALAVAPIADWLAAGTRPGRGARVYTTFNYGSYLTWRLPGYSASLDSRGMFPDSAVAQHLMATRALPPDLPAVWRHADVVIIPSRWRAAALIDTAAGWRRVALSVVREPSPDAAALWVRESWWRLSGRGPLPATPLVFGAATPAPRR
jgi:hypothetical protein